MKFISLFLFIASILNLTKGVKLSKFEPDLDPFDNPNLDALVDSCWADADKHGFGAITKK